MKIIIKGTREICSLAADMVIDAAEKSHACAMAFTAGRAELKVCGLISENSRSALSGCTAFNVCEYKGLADGDERSCAERLRRELYLPCGISNVFTPTEENSADYDNKITAFGGLELAVLGIGINGHIGFNEPATPYDSYTHTVRLTDKTRDENAYLFGSAAAVPEEAVTMGLKTICEAKNVILIALGEEKADIIHQLVYGKTTTYVPAAMLQMHFNMTLLLDEAAASKLD